MFSYFGSKSKLAPHYPKPQFPLIVEPFAGSAAYAFLHWNRDVWINELNPQIYRLWIWLRQARGNDLRILPILSRGMRVSQQAFLCPEQQTIMSLHCNKGSGGTAHRDVVTEFAARGMKTFRLRLARDIEKIRHWSITNLNYSSIVGAREATWFVDPPYQNLGTGSLYKYSAVDYEQLAKWCLARRGQLIVCEQFGADWLPFKPFRTFMGASKKLRVEVLFHRSAH